MIRLVVNHFRPGALPDDFPEFFRRERIKRAARKLTGRHKRFLLRAFALQLVETERKKLEGCNAAGKCFGDRFSETEFLRSGHPHQASFVRFIENGFDFQTEVGSSLKFVNQQRHRILLEKGIRSLSSQIQSLIAVEIDVAAISQHAVQHGAFADLSHPGHHDTFVALTGPIDNGFKRSRQVRKVERHRRGCLWN